MDTENKAFLPYFISEEIYSIDKIEVNEVNKSSLNQVEESKIEYKKPVEPEPNITLKIEGGNKKGVLILVNYTNKIPENEKAFLFKILSAINLTASDIALVDLGINKTPKQYQLVSQLACKIIIAFGTNFESSFPNETPPYTLVQLKNCSVIKSDSLMEVMNDTSKKKLLWEQLKTLNQS